MAAPRLAEAALALGGVAGLLVLAVPLWPVDDVARLLGIVVALLALAAGAVGALRLASPRGLAALLQIGSLAAAAGAMTVPVGLPLVALTATSLLGAVAQAMLEPRANRANLAAAGGWLMLGGAACLAGLVAVLLDVPYALAIGGLIWLRVVPFHSLARPLAASSGRAYLSLGWLGTLHGAHWLVRALAQAHAESQPEQVGWLSVPATLGALVAIVALPLVRRYRLALDLATWVDAAHFVAAIALATPLALAAALLGLVSKSLAAGALLLAADATNDRGQPARRLRDTPALVAFGTAFATLSALPPMHGFAAAWLLYMALIAAGQWPIAVLLALARAAAVAQLLRRVAQMKLPDRARADAPLAVALASLWLPLAVPVLVPIALLGGPISAAVAAVMPGVAWSAGSDVLLDVPGVVALVFAFGSVALGLAAYAEREVATLRRALEGWRRGTAGPWHRALRELALHGLPLGEVDRALRAVQRPLAALLRPWEHRLAVPWLLGVAALAILLALDS